MAAETQEAAEAEDGPPHQTPEVGVCFPSRAGQEEAGLDLTLPPALLGRT